MTLQQSQKNRLCSCLWLLTLVGVELLAGTRDPLTLAILADISRPNCESTFDGITYCTEDGGDIHLVIVDLTNEHIRFDMVMADDVTSVNTTQRERVEDMVNRAPYQDEDVVAAINADYFGRSHGPEGLTVKNGRRLDDRGGWRQNPNALWRSSLAISRLNHVYLGRKSAAELDDPRAYQERFYNAVGGGPLILSHGIVIPGELACLLERFPVGACRRTIQSAAGLSEDGQLLYLAAGRGRDIEGFARLLREYGAFTAIKLDGGGSSQLWYDGEMRHDTDRPVGNALLVFHSQVPAHDVRYIGLADVPVVELGEHVEIGVEIQNTGFLDWEPDLGYRFQNVQGWPVLGPAYQSLPHRVPAGSTLISSWTIFAPHRPGVYEAQWRLVQRTEPIGPRMKVGVVVLPPGAAETGLKERIEARLTAWRDRSDSDQEWSALSRELEREIWSATEEELRALLSDHGHFAGAVDDAMLTWWMPRPRPLAW